MRRGRGGGGEGERESVSGKSKELEKKKREKREKKRAERGKEMIDQELKQKGWTCSDPSHPLLYYLQILFRTRPNSRVEYTATDGSVGSLEGIQHRLFLSR